MREATSELVAWLHSLCEVPVIRCIGAQAATTPPTHFDHARPAQEPVPEPSTSASCTPSYMQILSCCIPQGDGSQPQVSIMRQHVTAVSALDHVYTFQFTSCNQQSITSWLLPAACMGCALSHAASTGTWPLTLP